MLACSVRFTDMTKVFNLNLKALPQTKSRDKLFVQYDKRASDAATQKAGHDVHVYDCTNLTKGTKYVVKLWRDEHGEPQGSCLCDARIVCKHIIKTIVIHVARVTARRRADNKSAVTLSTVLRSRDALLV